MIRDFMGIINLTNVSISFDGIPILENINFQINPNDKIGIMGLNGSGKTTLLRMILGELHPTIGKVDRQKGIHIAYIPQSLDFDTETSLLDFALLRHPTISKSYKEIRQYEQVDSKDPNKTHNSEILNKYLIALENFETFGGYAYENTIDAILSKLNLPHIDSRKSLKDLSPGEQKLAQFAIAFANEPNLLIIDEPTNHTDTSSSETIDALIREYDGTTVYVTHDRYLLNKIGERIIEIRNRSLIEYRGSYDEYLDFRISNYDAQMRDYRARQQKTAQLRKSMHKLRSWGKIGDDKAAKKAKILERTIEKISMPKPKDIKDEIVVNLDVPHGGGEIVLRASGVSKNYSDISVLQDVYVEVIRGDRIGVVGTNGSGKTTLINCLLGYTTIDHGQIMIGPSIISGYLSQANINLDFSHTVYQELQDAGCRDISKAYGLLRSWLFEKDGLDKKNICIKWWRKEKSPINENNAHTA